MPANHVEIIAHRDMMVCMLYHDSKKNPTRHLGKKWRKGRDSMQHLQEQQIHRVQELVTRKTIS